MTPDASPPWDEYFIRLAMLVAQKSKDPSTKVGCVIVGDAHNVLSTGFNGFPRRVLETVEQCHERKLLSKVEEVSHRWERPTKYDFVEHAERNAVFNAARHGIRLEGAIAYLNWEPYPCKDCAKAFIQAGIIGVVGPDIEFPNHKKTDPLQGNQWDTGDQWKFTVSALMMEEAGLSYRRVPWTT